MSDDVVLVYGAEAVNGVAGVDVLQAVPHSAEVSPARCSSSCQIRSNIVL